MSLNRKTLMILAGVAVMLSLTACTREITTTEVVDAGASNCFTCHTDQDPFLGEAQMEWVNSGHGIGNYVGYAGNRDGCAQCHSGAGFVAFLNGDEGVPYATSIGCWSCHAPHTNGDFQLRVTEAQTLADGTSMDIGNSNLCVACHKGRTDVNAAVAFADGADYVNVSSSHWGAHHGPQGDLFFGSNGYEFDGYTYTTAAPTAHTDPDNACLACHMNSNTVDLGGHSWSMANEGGDLNVAGCNNCHTEIEDFNVNNVMTDLDVLGEELHALLTADGILDVDGATVPGHYTLVQAGSLWNYLLWEEDRSHGVHNPDYIEGLLESSIAAMEAANR